MKGKGRKLIAGLYALLMVGIITGCADTEPTVPPKESQSSSQDSGFMLTGPGTYDSADTAIVTRIDKEDQTITFFNTAVSKRYTLSYDGATAYSDKYGEALSLAQIKEGDVVDVTFLTSARVYP